MKGQNQKHVILIFSAYIPPHTGGIERYVDNLTREFVERNITPVIVTTNFDGSPAEEIINGVQIFRLPIFTTFKNRYPIPKPGRARKEILAKLDKYNFDAIIVNTRFHLTSHIGAKYGQKRNIPVYLIEHGSNYVTLDNKFIDFFANRYEDFLTWRIKPKIQGFYGVSEACNDWLRKIKIEPSGVWYNSIDCKKPIAPQQHSGTNFLYAGRILKQKGVQNVLEAFVKLCAEEKAKKMDLYIAGDGPELDLYKQRYRNPNIHFLGRLDAKELRKQYASCDIFLYPPLWPEGLPTAILEAGLAKCAVVGTAQGGIKEILEDGENGLIVKPGIDDLSHAMKKLLEDKKIRTKLGENLFSTVQEKFSWQNTTDKILHDIALTTPERPRGGGIIDSF